jgi:hypothetical protein
MARRAPAAWAWLMAARQQGPDPGVTLDRADALGPELGLLGVVGGHRLRVGRIEELGAGLNEVFQFGRPERGPGHGAAPVVSWPAVTGAAG